ncbi:hypothetical protein ACFQZ0_00640 [Streptomyces erythrogriseus]
MAARAGVTAGALLGAFTYLVQSLLPALHTLMTALGAAGSRLLVVLDRIIGPERPEPRPERTRAAEPERAGGWGAYGRRRPPVRSPHSRQRPVRPPARAAGPSPPGRRPRSPAPATTHRTSRDARRTAPAPRPWNCGP